MLVVSFELSKKLYEFLGSDDIGVRFNVFDTDFSRASSYRASITLINLLLVNSNIFIPLTPASAEERFLRECDFIEVNELPSFLSGSIDLLN